MRRTFFAILFATLFATPVFAVHRVWNGTISANWSEPRNWAPEGVPTLADTIELPGWSISNSAGLRTVHFDLPAGSPVPAMTFLGEYRITGNAMTLTGNLGFRSDPSAVPVVFENDLKIGNTLRFGGPYQLTINGTLDINGQTLTMGTTWATRLNGPVIGSGTIVVEPRGVSLLGGGSFSGLVQGNAWVEGDHSGATFQSPWLTGTGATGPTNAALVSPGVWQPSLYHDPHEIGTLRTGPLSIASQYSVDLVPGGVSDQVRVTGSVSVAGTLAVTIPSGTTPLPGTSFVIIDNDGSDAVSGTFSGLPEGQTFTVGSTMFSITYTGGDGNDVVLNVGSGVKTWIGYTSDKWSNASNWSPPVVPQPGEALLFPKCCGSRANTFNDLTSLSVGLLSIQGSYTLGGNELTLTDDLSFAYGNSQLVYFTADAPLKLAASVRFSRATRTIYNGGIDVNGHTLTIDSVDTAINGPIQGSGAIIVNGPGVAIRGSGTFTGTITGNVDVVGAYPNADVTGARVTGDGMLGAVTAGTFAAGSWHPTVPASTAIGTLATGPLSVSSKFFVDLVASGPSDQVQVTGPVSIAGVLEVKLTGTPSEGQRFVLIDNDGTDAVSGTFTGLSEGATITRGATTLRLSYAGGDGNDIVLTVVPSGPTVKTWYGYANDIWSNRFNWSPESAPAAGEPLLFAPSAKVLAMNNNLTGLTAGTMTFQNSYTLTGNALTLAGDLVFANGVSFSSSVDMRLAAPVRFGAATSSTYSGAIDVNGQTLTIDSNQTSLRGALHGSGTIQVNGAGVAIASSGTFSGTLRGNADVVGGYPNATFDSTRLSGAGTLGAVTAGTLSPGSSDPCCADAHTIGTLQTGALSIATQLTMDLVSGGASDLVRVNGTVSLGGALDVHLTGAASAGQSFTLIDNDGSDAISGTFAGLPEGAALAIGGSPFVISYRGGDGNDVVLTAASNSNSRATSTAIAQNRETTEEHQPVTFTATVTASGGTPSGTVSFFAGSESLGSAPLANGAAVLTVRTLSIGTHQISATYAGNDSFDASTSSPIAHRVVKGNPNLTITSSSPTIVYGDSVSFAIAVSSGLGNSRTPTGTVTLTIEDAVAGAATLANNGMASITVAMLPAGVHLVTVSYSGDARFNAATASVTQTVDKAPTAVALQSLANPSPVGVPVTVAIQVSPTTDANMPVGGNVVVANGGETVTETQLIASAAAVRVGPLSGGEYAIQVTYAGNDNFQPATATLTQRVAQPAVIIPETSLVEGSAAYDELVRVELTEVSASPVTVQYRTVEGSATANVDYVEAQGTLVFNPGQTSATIPIRILGDATVEPDETFSIELTNVTGAAVTEPRVEVVIANDDLSHLAPVTHLVASEDGATLRSTFYAPAHGDGPWPVILWVPGDTAYDASGEVAALRETARGYAVLSVAYRSPASAPFPAQFHDLTSAVRWLRANAVTLNVDPNRIVAWGTGAGGHLAALLGTGMDNTDADSRVRAVVVWGGIVDLPSLQADSYSCGRTNWNAATSPASQLIGCPLPQCTAAAQATSPARYADRGDAPMLLMHGRADCFVAPRQSERLYDALKQAGVDVTLRIVDFVGHDDAYWTSAAAFAEVDAFLDAKLKPVSGRRRSARH